MANIGKAVSDGFRWGKIIDEAGVMVKVRWEVGGQSINWYNYQELMIPDGFD